VGREGDLQVTIEITEELRARIAARQFAVQTALGRVNAPNGESDLLALAKEINDFLVEDLAAPKLVQSSGEPIPYEKLDQTIIDVTPEAPREGVVQSLVTPEGTAP
jgi:hypothetical protein